MEVMMRNASMQPTSALPVTRNMPYYSASVPTRNQPRNMTGIYLGLEGNIKPPNSRGTIGSSSGRMRKGMSQKIRTPTEDRRYRMVELLRIKEDKRGFKGQPLKRRETQDSYEEEDMVSSVTKKEQLKNRKWGPAKTANPHKFEDVIRQNPRNYTNIVNSGVTRSENLTGIMSFAEQYGWDITNVPITDALVEEVSRIAKEREDLAGLEECFRKVCKGNVESMHSLLPLRKSSARSENYETGFTVRSYRNPKNAELLAHFDSNPSTIPNSRPKTVPARSVHNPLQPHVPAPYFFKYYNKPMTSHTHKKTNSPTGQYEEIPTPFNSERIIGLPGSGVLSRNLKSESRTGRTTAWSEGDAIRIRKGTPRTDSPMKEADYFNPNETGQSVCGAKAGEPPRKITWYTRKQNLASLICASYRSQTQTRYSDRLAQNTPRHDNTPNSTQPLEIRAEGYTKNNNNDDKTSNSDRNTEPPNTGRTESSTAKPGDGSEKSGNKQNKQAIPPVHINNMDGRIRLDLETEDGKKQQIVIDDKDKLEKEENERVKASEAKIASMKEVAQQRKKEFEQILTEHQEIVTSIIRQSSSESNNETFQENERDQ